MAWRVSWAALCATLMCDKPTMNTMAAPVNKQTMPAFTRVETPAVVAEIVFVVMFTLRETVYLGMIAPSCSAGLLTQRVVGSKGLPGFPVVIPSNQPASQLRGQSRQGPHLGRPIPCSLLGSRL
jgi:hypothetical protein